MLQIIRDRAQGIVVWAIVGLIIITFALFGLGSYLSGSSKSIVATVNGVEISETEFTQEFQRTQQYFQQMLGENYNSNMFDEKVMRQRVLDGLVQRELINQVLDDGNYFVASSDIVSNIQQMDAFKDESGNFSKERFEQVLSAQRMTADMLKQRVGRDLSNRYLQSGIQTSSFVTDQYLETVNKLKNQKRKVGYFLLPLQPYLSTTSVSDEEVTAYYDKNTSQFKTPEKVSVEYVELKLEDITRNFTVTEDEAKEYYDTNKESFVISPEARKVRHILIEVNDNVDEITAKNKAQSIYEQLTKGADFSELAKSESNDILSAKKGGDLGLLHRGDDLDTVFENTVFKMVSGEISKPVRSRFGYHLIQLEEIIPLKLKTFAEANAQIRKDLSTERADNQFVSLADKLYTLSFENPDSLTAVADELGLKIQKSELFTRTGGKGLFTNKKLVSAAFSDEVLTQNRNSDMLDLSDTHKVVLRIAEHQPSSTKPISVVKTAIVNTLKRQKAGEAVMDKANTIKDELEAGSDTKSIAAKHDIKWVEPAYIGRNPTPDSKVAPAIRATVFKLPVKDDKKATYDTVKLAGGGVAVVGVYEIQIDNEDIKITEPERQKSLQEFGALEFEAFMAYLKNKATISLNLKSTDQ